VTLGLVPLSGPVGALLRAARFLGRGLYDFEGLRRFKTKLKPTTWSAIFLSVPAPQPKALAILDVLAAFAGGSLGAFGLRALWSRPSTSR
jgi:phosphatidylglycerol lysyltransferase